MRILTYLREGKKTLRFLEMTREETSILGPLLRRVRILSPEWWVELKYQTQYGPEFVDFPYYPAAMEFKVSACNAINQLDDDKKEILIQQWRSRNRMIKLESEQEIVDQYGSVLLDYIIETAKWAASRSDFHS